MIEFGWARFEEEEGLLDFGNMVFSLSSVPTDFRALLPKVYGRPGFSKITAVARDDGRVVGMVAALPGKLQVLDQTLNYGYIGTVSTHPYHREKGIMKRLMPLVMERLQEQGCDFIALNGQRQRYMHHGFENAGERLVLEFTRDSLRHVYGKMGEGAYTFFLLGEASKEALDFCHDLYLQNDWYSHRAREDFALILSSWQGKAFLIKSGEENLGYLYATGSGILEYRFADKAILPLILQKYLAENDLKAVSLVAEPSLLKEQPRLFEAAASWHASPVFQVRVLNWEKVLSAFLSLKAKHAPLMPGSAVLEIRGEGAFELKVFNGQASVIASGKKPDFSLNSFDAIRLVFLRESALLFPAAPFFNWFPLPFPFSSPDAF